MFWNPSSTLCTSAVLVVALASLQTQAAFIPESRRFAVPSNTALAASSGLMHARPIGIGSAAPKTRITNVDLESVVETDDEWIRTRTGISSRHVLLHGENLQDLGIQAAKQALEMAGVDPTELDMVICATSSPDNIFGDAPEIANKLGCGTNTVAFDLTAACSGFLFAAVTAGKFLSADPKPQKALIIGADALSRWVDWEDRNVAILFGDGAGAMVLESTPRDEPEKSGLLGYAARSNGGGSCDLHC
jgi:3-oxoacyl-[acyl-carrier-protein] synthase-3